MASADFAETIARAKQDSETTWELIVLPCNLCVAHSPARACFLCGDHCQSFRDVLCDDIDAWLQQQACIKEHPIHQAMLNMNAQARSAQFMYKEDVPAVLAVCCSCDNYLRGRKGLPFFSAIQALHWHITTLQDFDGVKMDKRMMFGVCKRLLRRSSDKTNYYLSLFSPDERRSIAAMAQQPKKKNVAERELFRHFIDSTNSASVLKSARIAHKVRQCAYAPDGHLKPNVYKRSVWDVSQI
jgi:hypothetical protein